MELTAITPQAMDAAAINAGLSSFACAECGTHPTREQETRIIAEGFPKEMHCVECDSLRAIQVTVCPKSVHLLDETEARSMVWYHATNVADWHEKVSTGYEMEDGEFVFAHIGTKEAARDIATSKYFRYDKKAEVYLYQITLKETATLASYIADDETVWSDFEIADKTSLAAAKADAVRYLNRWEAPGSISLLVNASMLEFKSVKRIRN